MKRLLATVLTLCIAGMSFSGCGSTSNAAPAANTSASAASTQASASEAPVSKAENKKLTVGFSQIGQESGWRDAETSSIQFYAGQHVDTIDFKFADAQQKQENQIKAIKSFIAMGVDVIGLAPVVETGWDAVFTEAKDAGIPIILVDRKAKVSDDLYTTFIGSDFINEGNEAADELAKVMNNKGNIVELEGTVGASAANDRKKGFEDQLKSKYPDMKVLASQTGDFTRAKGKEVMESFIKTYGNKINGVYAHNDDMMLGAIEAMKEAGLKPGKDIKTVSCDGVKGLFEAMVAGEANVTVECNPLLGPQFFYTCQKLKGGQKVEKWIKSNESVFRADTAAKDLPTRVY